ncbi:hypothetical protein IC229_14780 [Spirosoma sp. BT702]|uniref:Metallo-beta-lactamase domain-containing protein n=1 Tax=Spirosoma profusum TaxID=2771354 RepID=A0A926XXL1_9BACT|nr:MBL fold metallo-hydrolase [Spirosoma profusum]MBD2701911.1 hypothetical protein [Spirosoma profusum]
MAKQPKPSSKKITHADVRMYRMGTGDCFIVKFFTGENKKKDNIFTMMIDCGTWQGAKEQLTKFIAHLKEYVAEDREDNVPTIDLLVVTHEHKDHVYGFDACSDLFVNTVKNSKNFVVNKIWMGWTENDNPAQPGDVLTEKVKQWKDEYGQRKKALNATAQALKERFGSDEQKIEADSKPNGLVAFQYNYADAVNQFADLHFSARAGVYTGDLEGMRVVKKEIANNNITYLHPGQIIDNVVEGLRFYVLGPPTTIEAIKKESGKDGETFSHSHNNSLTDNDAFATAMLNLVEPQSSGSVLPFDDTYIKDEKPEAYTRDNWRSIDHEWLNSAGSLALRMNSATNNLSLALAIEFIDSGRVMLFPGDAEFGSWESWHKDIKWPIKGKDGIKPLTEDLLNRTVFYKVAHHLSHNGTAKRQGVEMMTHPDLTAMATLDYDIISDGWKNTMPNRDLITDLLRRTKGRLVIMNENELMVGQDSGKKSLHEKILESREQLMNSAEKADFNDALTTEDLFLQVKVKA